VTDLDAALVASDCVVIATDHDAYDWAQIGERAQLIVDTRRAVRPVPAPAGAA
jgi:UDP-N-acetyl-D-glucosamine dehydrogenase